MSSDFEFKRNNNVSSNSSYEQVNGETYHSLPSLTSSSTRTDFSDISFEENGNSTSKRKDAMESVLDNQDTLPLPTFYQTSRQSKKNVFNPDFFTNAPTKGDTAEIKTDGGIRAKIAQEIQKEELLNKEKDKNEGYQFGTFKGVIIRSILNIIGVIYFLRLGWIVGYSGVWITSAIIVISKTVTTITTLSLSAIATNGTIGSGGAYYLISRNLGPNFGGAIGIVFSIANAVSVTMYVFGIIETLIEILPWHFSDSVYVETIVYSWVVITIFLIVVISGLDWVVKIEGLLLLILALSILTWFIGTFTSDEYGYSKKTFTDNMGPEYTSSITLFSQFSIFFPAVTGIMAGANISGDLKDAQKSIPSGTLQSIAYTSVIYMVTAWVLGATVPRDGDHGLKNDYLVQGRQNLHESFTLIGVFSATASSALAVFIGAPKVFQAVCNDKIFPSKINYFGKGSGQKNEPIRAYILTYVIAMLCVLFGDLNAIAPIITNFYLISYGMVNYACFSMSISSSIGWRPSFKYYSKWTALVGTILCVVAMFFIDYIASLITFFILGAIFKYLSLRDLDVNWGPAHDSQQYLTALKGVQKLSKLKVHTKTYRPQFLLLSQMDRLEEKQSTVKFISNDLKHGNGMFVVGQVIIGDKFDQEKNESTEKIKYKNNKLLEGISCFTQSAISNTYYEGVYDFLSLTGLGNLKPNVINLNFLEEWNSSRIVDSDEFVDIINLGIQKKFGVTIFRNMEKMDFSQKHLGTIDVYWLSDDGGLTLLLGYLLTRHKQWKNSNLRVFSHNIGSENQNVLEQNNTQNAVKEMLKGFRIEAEPKILEGLLEEPSQKRTEKWKSLNIKVGRYKARTKKFIKLSEVILENSRNADFVIISLTAPRNLDKLVYLSWLDILSKDLGPMVFVRGNGQTVLTFQA
ncbi:solute carrier family 12 [Anaeramoeba flamelloides]|uniref:Solute carrier family 12 n=1 Tax=Anaeramoeba flamelloides TaxID=1746091 RepID=A0ABQ8Y7J9_9EUKA|nr:solute carrier family 12 [Anaeramoeba flamelloides]